MKQTIEKHWMTKSGYEAIVRLNCGTSESWRCGYILIPGTSILHGINPMSSYISVSELNLDDPNVITKLKIAQAISNIEVHGGITFADKINYKPNESFAFAFGFDCAHSGDTLETCTLDYCINQCEHLASQLENIELLNAIKPVATLITHKTKPSNQLLSAVLGTKAWIVPTEQIKWNINNKFTDIVYKWSDGTQHNINIHEFAQLAKQWAANHSYQIYSKSTRNIGVAKIKKLKPGAKRRNLVLCEIKPTEVEAIIAAAEWVLKEINKCN